MEFRTHKIKHDRPPGKIQKLLEGTSIKLNLPLILMLLIILFLGIATAKAVKNIDVGVVLKAVGEDLKKDANGHTNFLLLGVGGGKHEGADLTDTIIVVSIDTEKNKIATVLSIPRDLFIKDPTLGQSRINEVFFKAKHYLKENDNQAIEYTKGKIEEYLGLPIHYWARIDFDGFKKLVDNVGGIDIEVKESIYDPFYPKAETFLYETFSIQKGLQYLDGETALKYARSRKTTSDFSRSERQHQIIYALKDKMLQADILLDQDKISEIFNTLQSHIQTNIKPKEILMLGSFAKDFTQENIVQRLIHDNPTTCGGFLYTPDRNLYGGMFVLVPAGGQKFIHLYSDLIFSFPEIAKEQAKIQILNGTKRGGVAAETKQVLQRFCFDITRFGNGSSKSIEKTTYYYKQKYDEKGKEIDSRPKSLDFLQKLIPGAESITMPQKYIDNGYGDEADIILEIGSDYTNSENYLSDPFYSLLDLAPPAPKTTEAATTGTTTTKDATDKNAKTTEPKTSQKKPNANK